MRVALVVQKFPVASETFVVRLLLGLIDRGCDAHIVCRDWDGGAGLLFPALWRLSDLSNRVHVCAPDGSRSAMAWRLPEIAIRTVAEAPRTALKHAIRTFARHGPIRSAGSWYRNAELIRLRPSVVHFPFGYEAVGREDIGDLLDCALVVSFQGYDINYAGLEFEPGFYDELWKRADCVHFVSHALMARAIERGLTPATPTRVVWNGVDPDVFQAGERTAPENAGTTERPLRVLSVGRLNWTKGYEYALEAVRQLLDLGVECEYRIVGGGELKEALLYTIDDLGLSHCVRLLGSLDETAVRDQMGWADVFLHTAVCESFSIVAAEAQAMRLPVVTSDAGGLPENVLDGETGLVVPRRNAAALATKMADLAADPSWRDRLGRAGRERVMKHLRLERFVSEIEELYQSAIEHLTNQPRN